MQQALESRLTQCPQLGENVTVQTYHLAGLETAKTQVAGFGTDFGASLKRVFAHIYSLGNTRDRAEWDNIRELILDEANTMVGIAAALVQTVDQYRFAVKGTGLEFQHFHVNFERYYRNVAGGFFSERQNRLLAEDFSWLADSFEYAGQPDILAKLATTPSLMGLIPFTHEFLGIAESAFEHALFGHEIAQRLVQEFRWHATVFSSIGGLRQNLNVAGKQHRTILINNGFSEAQMFAVAAHENAHEFVDQLDSSFAEEMGTRSVGVADWFTMAFEMLALSKHGGVEEIVTRPPVHIGDTYAQAFHRLLGLPDPGTSAARAAQIDEIVGGLFDEIRKNPDVLPDEQAPEAMENHVFYLLGAALGAQALRTARRMAMDEGRSSDETYVYRLAGRYVVTAARGGAYQSIEDAVQMADDAFAHVVIFQRPHGPGTPELPYIDPQFASRANALITRYLELYQEAYSLLSAFLQIPEKSIREIFEESLWQALGTAEEGAQAVAAMMEAYGPARLGLGDAEARYYRNVTGGPIGEPLSLLIQKDAGWLLDSFELADSPEILSVIPVSFMGLTAMAEYLLPIAENLFENGRSDFKDLKAILQIFSQHTLIFSNSLAVHLTHTIFGRRHRANLLTKGLPDPVATALNTHEYVHQVLNAVDPAYATSNTVQGTGPSDWFSTAFEVLSLSRSGAIPAVLQGIRGVDRECAIVFDEYLKQPESRTMSRRLKIMGQTVEKYLPDVDRLKRSFYLKGAVLGAEALRAARQRASAENRSTDEAYVYGLAGRYVAAAARGGPSQTFEQVVERADDWLNALQTWQRPADENADRLGTAA